MKRAGRTPRFFVERLDGQVVPLSVGEAHHARDVLRLSSGAPVEVFDGCGNVGEGTLHLVGRRAAEVAVVRARRDGPPVSRLHLAFAVPKGRRLDWLLEKSTELGVSGLWPVVFQRSVATPRFAPSTRERWRGVCIAAAKQCGLNFLPELHPPQDLRAFLEACPSGGRLMGQPEADTPAVSVIASLAGAEDICLLVGPEGGLTEAESQAARSAGFAPVRLVRSVLRVETAAVAMLAVARALVQPG